MLMDAALCRASQRGDAQVVARLLARGAKNAGVVWLSQGFWSTAVHTACMGGHTAVVERLLDAGASVCAMDSDVDALEVASCWGHLAIVELLLQRFPATEGCEPLHLLRAIASACQGGHAHVLQRLLAEVPRRVVAGTDADVNEDLVAASRGGHVAVVDLLVGAHGADVAWRDGEALALASKHGHAAVVARLAVAATQGGRRPPRALRLLCACAVGDTGAVDRLLTATTNINDDLARRAFLIACQNGQATVVQRMLAWGFDVHRNRYHYLSDAAANGHMAVAQLLVAVGVHEVDQRWAFWWAFRRRNLDLANLLLTSWPADAASLFGDAASTPGRFLKEAAESGDVCMVNCLLDAGADMELEGNLALWVACERGFLPVVQRLLEAGASVHAQNDLLTDRPGGFQYENECWPTGEYAIVAASRHGHLPVVELLLAAGARVSTHEPYRETPLMAACEQGHAAVAARLLAAGADVHAPEDVVRRANERCDIDLIAGLLSHTTDAHAVARADDTDAPIRRASEMGHAVVVELLLRHGADARRIAWDDLAVGTWPGLVTAVPRAAFRTLPYDVQPLWLRFHLRIRMRLRGPLQCARDRLDRPPSEPLETGTPTREQLITHLRTAGRRFAREYWTDGLPLFFPAVSAELGPVPNEFLYK